MDFTFPEISATNVVTWKCHVDDSAKVKFYMILGWDQLPELGLNLKFYEHVIEVDDELLLGIQHPWLIWVRMHLKI